MKFRQECFLIELPYDARLTSGLVIHHKDDLSAPREQGWTDFDLRLWLAREGLPGAPLLDMAATEESMVSTTLFFNSGDRRGNNPFDFVRDAWPTVFEQQLRDHPWPRRLLYYQPVLWLRERLPGRLGLGRKPRRRHTVVKAVRIAPEPSDVSEQWVLEQLRSAHAHLREYLAAAATVHGDPELRPVTLQDLPFMVVGYGSEIPQDHRQSVAIERRTCLIHERSIDRPRQPIGQAEADVAMWVSAAAENPMFRVMVFLTSAHQAAYRGEFTQAVVDAGTSVEMLMAAAFRFSAPEHGYSSKKLQNVLENTGFKNLLIDHCAGLFGYGKDLDTNTDELGRWWQAGYALRNRAVHSGAEPTEDETWEAVNAAETLFRDLGDRLKADPKVEPKLPQVPQDLLSRAKAERAAITGRSGPHA